MLIERNLTKVSFEADGSGVQETTVVMRVQSQAGIQQLAVLAFPYTSDNQTVEVDYVRVRKSDVTLVLTPGYNIQDMPAEVSRRAPMYSDVHEKHVTVKALAVGDTLEYVVRYRSAVFTIVFSPVKPNEVRFVSGDESLKSMTGQLGGANYKMEFPDLGPFQLFRRGMVVCASVTGCDVVLLLPNDTQ